jgi:hypothetical protein
MRTLRRSVFIVVALGAGWAHAQDPPLPKVEPPAIAVPLSPPSWVPPPPGVALYPQVAPAPWASDVARAGARNRAAGAALITIGALGLVGGVTMAGVAVNCRATSTYYDRYDLYSYPQTDCVSRNDGLLAAGVVTGIVGGSLIVGGIAAVAIGNRQRTSVRREWSLLPVVGSAAQGLVAALKF